MEDRLKEIIISITNRCNLRCEMCEIPQIDENGEMTTEELQELIRDATNLYPHNIIFSGGEPLLRKDIFELISFANKYKISACLTSNGTLIDDEVVKKLASSGIGVVNISIEGPEDIHDSLRGKGNFKKALGALKHLARYKIETTIATVVCKQNYNTLPYVIELAHQYGATTVKFQPFNEIFLIKKNEKEKFFASPNVVEKVEQNIDTAIKLSKEYKIATNPVNYLYAIPKYICGLWQNYPLKNSCHALWSSCPISPEGNVYLCWVLSDKILGNVRETKISKIWNSEEHNRLRQRVIKEGCLGCMMSCYDYNFDKYGFSQPLSLKVRRLKKSGLYKRLYYRIYQYLRYILRKILNRIITNLSMYYNKNNSRLTHALKEIKIAKDMLKIKLKTLEKDERS